MIDNEVNKANYDALIVQSGSVDISNLKTNVKDAENNLEYFKQKTIVSAHNLFQAVTKAEEHDKAQHCENDVEMTNEQIVVKNVILNQNQKTI